MSEQKHTPIPGFPGYEIDVYGNVFSVAHNWRGYGVRRLVQNLNSNGYPSVRLTVQGRRTHYSVHKLMGITFLSPRPSSRHETRHLDGDKTNNAITNLAWGTRKDNADDRERHGRTSRGPEHSIAVRMGQERIGWNVKW